MKESVVVIANNIINELRNSYYISDVEFEDLKAKVKNIKVNLIDPKADEIHYEFYTDTDELYSTYVTKQFGQSHTIEYPPVFINGKLVPIMPLINLICYEDPEEFLSSVYHELIHFLSIGKWNILPSETNKGFTVDHYSGIILRHYLYFDNKIEHQSQDITMLNEAITDWMAQFFYTRIEGKIYHSGQTYRHNQFYYYLSEQIEKNNEENKFIGAYITNKLDVLQAYLLGSYPNFQKLNDALINQETSI